MLASNRNSDFEISIINDEVDQDFERCLKFLRLKKINLVEVRTVNQKNILDLSDQEIFRLQGLLDKYQIRVSAISSPLFKWYPGKPKNISNTSSYGFPEYLTTDKKNSYIKRAFNIAKRLKTKSIRIFSLLIDTNSSENDSFWTLESNLFNLALELSTKSQIQLLVENGFGTNFRKNYQIIGWEKYYSKSDLYPLFDFANAYFIGEKLDLSKIPSIAPFINYLHIKDYQETSRKIVPFGNGNIHWTKILGVIKHNSTNKIVLSLEFDGKYSKDILSNTISKLRLTIKKLNQ